MPRQTLRKNQRGGTNDFSDKVGDGPIADKIRTKASTKQAGGSKKNRRRSQKQQRKSRKQRRNNRKSRRGGNPAFLTPGVLLALQKYVQHNPLKF